MTTFLNMLFFSPEDGVSACVKNVYEQPEPGARNIHFSRQSHSTHIDSLAAGQEQLRLSLQTVKNIPLLCYKVKSIYRGYSVIA
jgi:hypothetical protein